MNVCIIRKYALVIGAAVVGLAAAGPGTASAGVVHAADADTILLWHLDDTTFSSTTGGDALDAGSNQFNGDVFDDGLGSASQTVFPGKTTAVAGTSYLFKGLDVGTGQRNEVRSATIPTTAWNGGAFTVEMWVNLPNLSKLSGADGTLGRVLAEQRDANKVVWALGLQPDANDSAKLQFRFFTNASGSSDSRNTSSQSWEADTWYYVALVSDPSAPGLSAGESLYTLYRRPQNGTLAQVDQFTADTAIYTGDGQFRIGGEDSNTEVDRNFYGYMDEAHYSNSARSLSYLQSHSVVPEPASLGLLCVGGLLMLCRRRK